MLFSRRKGFSPVKDVIQKEGMDDALRNGLWNALHLYIWGQITANHYIETFNSSNSNVYSLFQHYWLDLFKIPLDDLPNHFGHAYEGVRKYFFECEWYEVYDFVEFTAQHCPEHLKYKFIEYCNHILEKELSAYRFIDSQLTAIISEEEIESIESAIDSTTKYSGANKHLKTSLKFLSDRKSPDYRNSVKESISAVESICVSVSGDHKATLGAALNEIEKSHQLHPAFKKALSSLYGYTSDSSGIRHALLEESTITYSDAKFMLVLCSAFVNYILGKISEESQEYTIV
jgi:hypothetical protein